MGLFKHLLPPKANSTANGLMADVIGNKSDSAASGAVTSTDSMMGYIKQLVTADISGTAVLGALADAAATGAVTSTDTVMAYIKQLVTAQIAQDAVVGALADAAAAGAVTNTDTVMAYIKQLVTAQIAQDGVVGALDDAAATGAVTSTDTAMAYIKQLVTAQIAQDGVVGALADAAATGPVTSTDTVMAYIKQLITAQIAQDAVVGALTDAAATGAVTETDTLMAYVKQIVTAEIAAATVDLSIARCVEKSDGIVPDNTTDDLFTISGGPIFVTHIFGFVSTTLSGTANGKLQITVTEPSATIDMNAAAVAIDNDAAGTSYYPVGATGVFTPVTAGYVKMDPVTVEPTQFLCPPGTIRFHSSAACTGAIKWYMRYIPMSPSCVVAAAA